MNTYDIFLSKGCASPPNINDLAEKVPELISTRLLSQLLDRQPNFLGLDLSLETAAEFVRRLRASRALGIAVPSGYRQPKITIDEAFAIAEPVIKHDQRRFPDVTFGPVQFSRDETMWWVFVAVSEELIERGLIPGAITALVDKLDGHVWQPGDIERYMKETHQMY